MNYFAVPSAPEHFCLFNNHDISIFHVALFTLLSVGFVVFFNFFLYVVYKQL